MAETGTAGGDAGRPLLEMRGLHLRARTRGAWTEILHGIDIELRRGEVLGVIGESGAGKSTVGLAAMGFVRDGCEISDGEVIFEGRNLLAMDERERRRIRGSRIAYVAQSAAAAFNPAHRILRQCIEMPVRRNVISEAEAKRTARRMFRMTGLPEPDTIGDRYPHQVSGGQLQRMMAVMAMMSRPDLIVFDEPTTALDVTTQVEVLGVIQELVEKFGTAAIYISHDLAVVAQLTQRIAVLRYGNLVEEGRTHQILNEPVQDYTRQLVSAQRVDEPARVATSAAAPQLNLEGITASYGDVPVVHDVDLTASRGRTVAIIGESGSGKSTIARVIAGLLPPVRGRVTWKGSPLAGYYRNRAKDHLRQIQLIYQSPDKALNPRQTIRVILGRPLSFYLGLAGAEREQRLRELLNIVELDPDQFLDRRPSQLSGGQKQRICIARALAANPDLIICDEVTSALDSIIEGKILDLLMRLQKEYELSYLFISHDMGVVRAIADEVVVMHLGQVVERGTKDKVLRTPTHPYTQLLLASAPELRMGWLDEVRPKYTERREALARLAKA